METYINPVGYALAGFGRFCRNRLVPAFNRIEGSDIVALWKRNAVAAKHEAEDYGIPAGYSDFEAMLNDPDVEVVYVTSANSLHEEHAIAAAQAGKHVLCEKPLAITSESCKRIISACDQAGVKLMVAHNLRYSGAVKRLKQLTDTGDLGEIISATITFTYEVVKSPRSWVYDRQIAGGGALMDVGVHCIDTLRYLFGNVCEATGTITPPWMELAIEESARLVMTFECGTIGNVHCSYTEPYGNSLEILGTMGRARVERIAHPDIELDITVERKTGAEVIKVNTGNSYGKLISDFSAAIRGQKPVPIPGEEGLKNQQIIDAIYAHGCFRR
jgi:predicted dehydrogenase